MNGGRLSAGVSPGHARETLTPAERQLERVMLLTRLADGCPVGELEPAGRDAAAKAVADGLADPSALAAGRVVLTLRGRLLADAVIRDLTPLGPTASRSLPAQRTGPCAR